MGSRRTLLRRLAAAAGSVGLAGCSSSGQREDLGLSPNPHREDLPARQHAWDATLSRDEHGNRVSPRHHRVLLLDLETDPDRETARTVERSLRSLEAAYEWGPTGLLHAWGWGTRYFERQGTLGAAPIERPRVLSRTDDPDLQSYDAVLVLASDVPATLTAVDAAMFGDRSELGSTAVDARLGDAFAVGRRLTGFMGEGLPARHTAAEGVPDAVPDDVPMFTGFFSGRSGTQATEDRVTIPDGRWRGGTTLHHSHLELALDGWWSMDDQGRVARMFGPHFTPEDVRELTDSVPFTGHVADHARTYGVVGHHEKVARARRDGTPVILRRDFDTTDGGRAGVHFLAYQRSLADFRRTRKAMNGWYLRDDHPDVTDRENNGLLEFISVRSRANFYVPPRERRAAP